MDGGGGNMVAGQSRLEEMRAKCKDAGSELFMHFDKDHKPGVFMFNDKKEPAHSHAPASASGKNTETLH